MSEWPTPTTIDVSNLIDKQKFSRFQLMIIMLSCAVMFNEGYDMQAMSYAAPAIIKAWHVDKSHMGSVFGAGLFGYMLGATLLSNLADRFGRKKIIIGGSLLFGAFTLGAASSFSLTDLLVLRFVAGIGLGVSIASVIALAAEYAPSRARALTISILFTGYTVGSTAAGFIAAKFIPIFGWPIVFYVGGIAPIILSVGLIFTLPESVRFLALKKEPDRVAAILAKLIPYESFDSGVQFILREESKGGLPVKHLFTEGRASMTSMLWFAFIASLMGHTFLLNWVPTVLVDRGMSLSHAVISGALITAGGTMGGLLAGWLLDKQGIIVIAISFAIAAPLVVFSGLNHMSDTLLMAALFLTGIFMLGGQAGLNAICGTIYPTYIRSTGAGWAFGMGRIGAILGPVVGGVLISLNLPVSLLFIYAAIPFLCCAGTTFLLGRVHEDHRAQEALRVP